MSNYAYLDNAGILHLHPLEREAAKHGKYVETSLDMDESGFPIIEGEGVVYYHGKGTAYTRGNETDGRSIAVPSELKQLANRLE
ncbi:hypothetical protein [Paenibacillus polymyxa]|uniref:Uncharacterized protein n=1 Tax=Paenibacillus polymyxa TaxID=1406 RepID=A0ABX2ZB83_PAEPO|nr:hypothetical protein [Paenibacillus polymyxa]ODA08715.1 hypothetical protein A7312_04745 [Paenibacillus polymyxa]